MQHAWTPPSFPQKVTEIPFADVVPAQTPCREMQVAFRNSQAAVYPRIRRASRQSLASALNMPQVLMTRSGKFRLFKAIRQSDHPSDIRLGGQRRRSDQTLGPLLAHVGLQGDCPADVQAVGHPVTGISGIPERPIKIKHDGTQGIAERRAAFACQERLDRHPRY